MLESSWSHRHFNFVTFTRKILSIFFKRVRSVWYVSEYKLKNSFSSVDLSIKYTHPQSFYYCFSTISGQLYHLNRRQKLHSAQLYSHFVYFFSLFECYSEREIIKNDLNCNIIWEEKRDKRTWNSLWVAQLSNLLQWQQAAIASSSDDSISCMTV